VTPPLEEEYLNWLFRQIAERHIRHPRRTYWHLLAQLHHKRFVSKVKLDWNRVQDGKDLRREFLGVVGLDPDPNWLEDEKQCCTFLELMVVLSRKLAYDLGNEPSHWFWELVGNLELTKYWDRARRSPMAERGIDDILNRVMLREYAPDGQGGFFPLQGPNEDQRGIQLWDQLNAYVLERI
jgi:hypothetical protein